ncbi:MAG: MFS transporter, partial [Thermoplasmatales archaeon]
MEEFAVLDNKKFSKFHAKLVFTTGVGAFTDLYNTIAYTAAVYSILSVYHTTLVVYGYIGFLFFVGGVIGALTWGIVADLIGRKKAFLLDLILMAIFALLSGVFVSLPALYVLRFLIGFTLGGDYPAALTMLSEYSPIKRRGSLLTTFWTIFAAGGFVAGIVGYFTLVHFGISELQMRIMLASGAIPAAIGIASRIWIPESPRWLAKKGRYEDAISSLSSATGLNFNKDYFNNYSAPKINRAHSLKLFFSRKYAYVFTALAIVVLLPNFIPTAAASFSPYLFSIAGIPKVRSVL